MHIVAKIAPLLALAVAACSSGRDLPPMPDGQEAAYHLGPGDTVRIITVGSEPLTGQFQVDYAGNVATPLLGIVPAAGLTPQQLQARMESRLQQANLLNHPSVSIEVTTYRPFYILGEVTKPGAYPYQPGMTVLQAVSLAGGYTYRAETDCAAIQRQATDHTTKGCGYAESHVVPGDTITVYEQRRF